MTDKLSIHTIKGRYFFLPEEIIRLEAFSNYTTIYLTDQRKFMTSKVLKTYVPTLESLGFIRAHRTHLINPDHIYIIHNGGIIQMKDDTRIQISRRKKSALHRCLDIQIEISK